ncbi:helix-turn-helix domain-containing protein [Natrialbaceae archaeon A-gly3]
MATVVELEVPSDRLGGARAFERVSGLEFRVDGVIGYAPPLVYVCGPDRRRVESALESDPSLEVVATIGGESQDRCWLFQIAFGRDLQLFAQLIREADGVIATAGASDRTWSLELLFEKRAAVSRAYDLLDRYGFSVTVVRMASVEGTGGVHSTLTETQYETVVAAYEHGYFDVPREVTLRELAAELEVSHQALSERLRRGQAALVGEELLDEPESTTERR